MKASAPGCGALLNAPKKTIVSLAKFAKPGRPMLATATILVATKVAMLLKWMTQKKCLLKQ